MFNDIAYAVSEGDPMTIFSLILLVFMLGVIFTLIICRKTHLMDHWDEPLFGCEDEEQTVEIEEVDHATR